MDHAPGRVEGLEPESRPYTSGVRKAPFHIAISGLIGAGKSTLVTGLAPLVGAQPLLERAAQNPYLERFYGEPHRWAFQSFASFFEQSLSDEVDARQRHLPTLQERVVEEHVAVFGQIFLSRRYLERSDLEIFLKLTQTANALVPPADLLIHVDIDPTEALRRIQARGRPEERPIDLDYLKALSAQYEIFVGQWSESSVLSVSAEEYDFRDSADLRVVAAKVEAALDSTRSS